MTSKIINRALDTDPGASGLQHIALSDEALAAVLGGGSEPPPPSAFGDLYASLLALDAQLDAEQAPDC